MLSIVQASLMTQLVKIRLPLQYSGLENSMHSPWGCKELDTTERLSLFLVCNFWYLFNLIFIKYFSTFFHAIPYVS